MAEPWVKVRDLHGPFKGQLRDYRKSAAEVAVQTGFAEWPESEPVVEVAITPAAEEVKPETTAPMPTESVAAKPTGKKKGAR